MATSLSLSTVGSYLNFFSSGQKTRQTIVLTHYGGRESDHMDRDTALSRYLSLFLPPDMLLADHTPDL